LGSLKGKQSYGSVKGVIAVWIIRHLQGWTNHASPDYRSKTDDQAEKGWS